MTSAIVPNIINEMCSFHEGTQAKRVSSETIQWNFNSIVCMLRLGVKLRLLVGL